MGCKGSTFASRNGMGQNGSSGSGSKKPASSEDGATIRGKTSERGDEIIFGTGVHVGRAGNVDLTGRNMDFLGTNIVNMINEDELHRKATSLTLTSNALYTLGKELSLLPDLEGIDMDSNRFTRLPEMLTKLPKLWRINISLNPIDPIRGFDVAPRLVSLRCLALRDCNLTFFPSRILECEKLEELDISDNPQIDLHDVAINSLSNIKTLVVANCGLSGKTLPACIRRTTGLVSLDISNNQFNSFDDVPMDFLGKSIPKTLKDLHLRGMQLTSVPLFVATLKKLNSLDLALNPIETLDVLAGRFVKRIPRSASAGNLGHGYASTSPQSTVAGGGTDGGAGLYCTSSPQGGARTDCFGSTSSLDVMGGGREDEGLGGSAPLNGNTCNSRLDDDNASLMSDGRVSTSSRISMSKVSKAGMIAPVSHPIPLKKLSLRACGLRTVPKYFHKMSNLEELDISENDQLDDANMTLFSLQNLKVLIMVGCPFAEDPSTSRNEWFDIAKLRKLSDLQWELWKGNKNMSPYRTKIPIEICSLPLRRINQVKLRKDLFVGNTVETVVNLLRDGYFKVDLAVDDNTLYSLVEAIEVFAHGHDFFFPKDIKVTGDTAAGKANTGDKKANASANMLIHGKELGQTHLHIAVNRYIFFLAMQAANYDAVIIPPLDVMIIHYSQVTCNPVKYRADCEAICGRILNCNYRAFFLEQKRYPQAAKDAVAASKKIWNLMVRSAQTELGWLRYDFWDRRARNTASHVDPLSNNGGPASAVPLRAGGTAAPGASSTAPRPQTLPREPCGSTDQELFADFSELRSIDSTHDLCGVLDQAITSHFLEQADDVFSITLEDFFLYNDCFRTHTHALSKLSLDWTRYVKYMALYAYRIAMKYRSDSTIIMEPMADVDGHLYTPIPGDKRTTSLLGPHYDNLNNVSFAGPGKYLPLPKQQASGYDEAGSERRPSGLALRSTSMLSTASRATQKQQDNNRRNAIQHLEVDPIPTVGITLLLHAHRTTHVKYFQTLSLLGIEDTDITWQPSKDVIEETKKAWKAVYEEVYIGPNTDFKFRVKNGLILPMVPLANGNPSSNVNLCDAVADATLNSSLVSVYSPTARPRRSILSHRTPHRKDGGDKPAEKKVLLCGGDTEFGAF